MFPFADGDRPRAGTFGAGGSKAILVLHTDGHDRPARLPFDTGLARGFREGADVKVDLYIETLDPGRFAGEPQARMMREYLREKYAGKKIAVVIAVNDHALAFLLDERDALFPGVPIAAWLTRHPRSSPERVSAIWSGNYIGDSVALALRLHPRTRQIAIIDGAPGSSSSDAVYPEALSQIAAMRTRVPVTFLVNLPLEELLARVQALPPESVIFMARQNIGRRGEPVDNSDALAEIARVARAPIYVGSDELIGLGAVGGVVVSIASEATRLARLALRLAGNGSLRIPPAEGVVVPTFDWRQLRRWGIGDDLLPPQSDVRFRELGFWDRYRWHAAGALSVFFTESALIGGLLLLRVRRQRAEVALRDSESALRSSDHEVQTLAGRLIAAQEEERARIARELHDDLSQQLALLSIEIDQLVTVAAEADGVIRQARAAAIRAGEIATGLHNLSHELHPVRLEMLGLGPALRGLCGEMSSGHDLQIAFEHRQIPQSIPPDVALCLFRIAQEALRNVVKHSGAREAQVRLSHADGMLELHIADSGRGFSHGPHDSDGLGLVSMRERVHIVGGQIAVHASAGKGTRIDVRVPVK
jgi:signal transduction histidine kinase